MLAYMNEESYNRTVETGLMTYYSRIRQELWLKGDTSGHYQYVKDKQKKAAIESLPELKFVPKAMCPKMSDAKKPTL